MRPWTSVRGPTTLSERWAAAPPEWAEVLATRSRQLLTALDAGGGASEDPIELAAALDDVLTGAGPHEFWLALAVLRAALPTSQQTARVRRAAELDGPSAALDLAGIGELLATGGPRNSAGSVPQVRVVTGAVLVDVHDTSRSLFGTGIQRVTRQTARRWVRDHDVLLVAWDEDLPGYRSLGDDERMCAIEGATSPPLRLPASEVLVPWASTIVIPELFAEPGRAAAVQSLASDSGNRSVVIGYDCVPLTTAEVVATSEMAEGYASYLSALARVSSVAPISVSSGVEFEGWRRMLGGAGLVGPEVRVVGLPVEVPVVSPEVVERVRGSYCVADLPLVLVVGSHEPRKNHRAVLAAAELLWREGLVFSLTFVGGNAWASESFVARVAGLSAAGRAVSLVSSAPDEELWAAYRVARFSVFPSLNEGFGLPVAESLAAGTPVVTSGFGSMAEIAAGGGAWLVDPRDVVDLAAGMRRLLTDELVFGSLVRAAGARVGRTWDAYAAELWEVATERSDAPTVPA